MRRFAIVLGSILLVSAAAAGGAVLWVERGLAAAEVATPVLCFDARDKAKLAAGRFSLERKDLVVTKSIAFQYRPGYGPMWPLRGAAIHFVYTSFWSPRQREAAFERFAARMKTCHWAKPGGTTG